MDLVDDLLLQARRELRGPVVIDHRVAAFDTFARTTNAGLHSENWRQRRAALIALDQMPNSRLSPEVVVAALGGRGRNRVGGGVGVRVCTFGAAGMRALGRRVGVVLGTL